MRAGTVLGTGIKTQVVAPEALARRLAAADRPGEHLWTLLAVWEVSDPERPEQSLDTETMLSVVGPGCFKCEREYSRQLARQPCTGSVQ